MDRFTKRAGRKRKSQPQFRLTDQEHQKFCSLVLGGDRAVPGRLRDLARALDEHLSGEERADTSNPYNWLTYRVHAIDPMLISDAAKIFLAGMRMGQSIGWNPADWHTAVNRDVPVIERFHHGYGVPGRFPGVYDAPFVPVMLPLEYISTLSEELAGLLVLKDDGRGLRKRTGTRIEKFLHSKITNGDASGVRWNQSAVYAIEQIALRVLYLHFYRGRLGLPTPQLEEALIRVGQSIENEFRRALADVSAGAFERTLKRLNEDVVKVRNRAAD